MTAEEIRRMFEDQGAQPLSHEASDCTVAVLIEIAAQLAELNFNIQNATEWFLERTRK